MDNNVKLSLKVSSIHGRPHIINALQVFAKNLEMGIIQSGKGKSTGAGLDQEWEYKENKQKEEVEMIQQEKNGAVKIWVEEEIKVNCRYEEGQDYIEATPAFPMAISSIGYIDLLRSHPEINKVDALSENRLAIYVKVERSMPFESMVKKCLGVIAGALYVRISK